MHEPMLAPSWTFCFLLVFTGSLLPLFEMTSSPKQTIKMMTFHIGHSRHFRMSISTASKPHKPKSIISFDILINKKIYLGVIFSLFAGWLFLLLFHTFSVHLTLSLTITISQVSMFVQIPTSTSAHNSMHDDGNKNHHNIKKTSNVHRCPIHFTLDCGRRKYFLG